MNGVTHGLDGVTTVEARCVGFVTGTCGSKRTTCARVTGSAGAGGDDEEHDDAEHDAVDHERHEAACPHDP